MVRPRWHDALIIGAIVTVFSVGVWALWWGDVRGWFRLESDQKPADPSTLVRPGGV